MGVGVPGECETSPVGLWPLLFVCLEIAVLVYTCGSLVKLAVPIYVMRYETLRPLARLLTLGDNNNSGETQFAMWDHSGHH